MPEGFVVALSPAYLFIIFLPPWIFEDHHRRSTRVDKQSLDAHAISFLSMIYFVLGYRLLIRKRVN